MMDEKLLLALILTVSITAAAGYLGTLMLTKRMSLAGGPLGHLTLPGIAIALIYGFDVSLGAFLVLSVAIFLIWIFERWTKLPMETLTAIVFTSSVAIAFLFLPEEETVVALIGDISQISLVSVGVSFISSIFIFAVIYKIYKKMVFIAISEDLAKSENINVDKYNLIYLAMVALVIGLSVRIVGSLLTAAIVSIPAATSRNFSKNINQYAFGGAFIGAVAGFWGVVVYKMFEIPIGPGVIIAGTIMFLISAIFKRK